MTEVRTTSRTGGQKGVKPQRYDLLPKAALDMAAEVYAFGATKYADHNWRKRYEWSKSYAAAMRHLTAFWDGETFDEESGLPHLGHAMFHLFALATWLHEDGEDSEFDDRFKGFEELIDAEELGFVDETTAFAPFAREDLTKFQEQVNRTVRNLADVMRMPQHFIKQDQPIIVHHTTAWQPPQDASFINDAHNGGAARG